MYIKMMYNIITFIGECIPISNGKVQHCKTTIGFAFNLIV